MLRPRIKRTTEPIDSPDGDILLMRPSAGTDIRIESPDEGERRLLAALDGEHTLEQLHEEFGEEAVGDAISKMQELEVIEDAADDDLLADGELARFDRQLRYFSDVGTDGLTPSECQRRLREAKVAVLGVGGLGGSAAWALACCGVGEMWLIDGDRVEVSNLNRQILYTEADIGLLKVEAAAARLRAFNSAMQVTATARRLESEVEIADFIDGADVVVDAADWPAHDIERWCNAACFEAGIPYITMSHFPPIARVGPLYVPGQTGCYICQETAYRRRVPALRRRGRAAAREAGPGGDARARLRADRRPGGDGGDAPADRACASPRPWASPRSATCGRWTVEREPVVPEPDCPVCGHLQPAETVSRTAGG